MDYSVGKKILASQGKSNLWTVPFPTSTPAVDYVNPGLGNFARIYCHYVPIYRKNYIDIEKKVNEPELFGGGESDMSDDKKLKTIDSVEKTTEELNKNVLKKLNTASVSAFLHPRFVQTGKISFETEKQENEPAPKKIKSSSSQQTQEASKPLKHKFQFF